MTSESDPLDGGPGDLGNPAANPYASPTATSSDAGKISTHHPIAFWFFFWGEFAERCSFYGMKVILPQYLTKVMLLSDTLSTSIQSWFKTGCYILPLVGGFLADRYFGKYWTIVGFAIPYVLGHFVLGIPNMWAVGIALCLLAGGSGVIKPNISTLMGQTYDRQRPGQEPLRSAAFMWFYVAINIGAFLSTIIVPWLRDRNEPFGLQQAYAIAFQFPAWVMVASLIVFALGKPFYTLEPIERRESTPEERKEQRAALKRLFPIFFLIVFFWIVYEPNDSLWIYFVRDYINRNLFGMDKPIEPDKFQWINPLLVLLLVPCFNWCFKRLDPHARVITPTRRILAGFILAAASAAVMSAVGFQAHATEDANGFLHVADADKLSCAWYFTAYSLLTMGEILLFGTALELAYAEAPKRMKSFVTACFLFTSAAANMINSGLCQLYGGSLEDAPDKRGPMSPGAFFAMTALIGLAATIAFVFVGRRFDRQKRIVEAEGVN